MQRQRPVLPFGAAAGRMAARWSESAAFSSDAMRFVRFYLIFGTLVCTTATGLAWSGVQTPAWKVDLGGGSSYTSSGRGSGWSGWGGGK